MTLTHDDRAMPARPKVATARRPGLHGGRWLRYGVAPFFFALDVVAYGAALLAVSRDHQGVWVLVVGLALNAACGLYRSRLTLSVLDDAARIVGRALAAAAAVSSVALVVGGGVSGRVLAVGGLAGALGLVLRSAGYTLVRRLRSRGLVAHPTLVLGAGAVGVQLASLLGEHPEYGLRVAGFLDRDPLVGQHDLPAALLGTSDDLARVIVEHDIQDLIVAFGSQRESDIIDVIRTCDRLDCEIFFVPRLFELHQTGRDMDAIWGLPLVRLRRATFRSPTWALKRVFDVVTSGLALLVLSPLLLAVMLAVRVEGGPGVIFRQQRVGLDGRPFEIMKFRSLRPVDDTESATRWNIKHDDRLGPVGRFIRATSLDELAQLWNIFRGDMSVVGPRPERQHFVDAFSSQFPRYTARHRVPSGLTGWAQVHGLRGDTSIEERARFDNYYIENWSVWLDVKIVLMTVGSVLRRTGG